MDINAAKWVVLATLFLLTFIFSMLPLKLLKTLRDTIDPVKRARYARVVSLLSCFAAGVFMATGLLDLFPEVNEILEKAIDTPRSSNFPVAEFTVAFGFFLVLILEQIVLDYKEHTSSQLPMVEALPSEEVDQECRRLRRSGSIEGISDHPHSQEADCPIDESEAHSTLRSVLLLAALSMHSLFEGLAIGLQPDVTSVLQIFVAVVLHKVIIAFSLGLNLVQSELKLWAIVRSNLLFCVTSPLGMGIAMGLEEFGQSMGSSVVNGVLQGLACGTFVYVTFFEVLPHELNHGRDRLLKVLVLLVGFSVVCGVLFLEPSKEPVPNCPTNVGPT